MNSKNITNLEISNFEKIEKQNKGNNINHINNLSKDNIEQFNSFKCQHFNIFFYNIILYEFNRKHIFCKTVLYNLINFRINVYNVFLIIGLIYIFISLFYLVTKKFFSIKGDIDCLKCFYITVNIIYFILPIIAFTKLINDKKNKLEEKYQFFIIFDICLLFLISLIFILQIIHIFLFFRNEN